MDNEQFPRSYSGSGIYREIDRAMARHAGCKVSMARGMQIACFPYQCVEALGTFFFFFACIYIYMYMHGEGPATCVHVIGPEAEEEEGT